MVRLVLLAPGSSALVVARENLCCIVSPLRRVSELTYCVALMSTNVRGSGEKKRRLTRVRASDLVSTKSLSAISEATRVY